jgi:glutathione S-transferase
MQLIGMLDSPYVRRVAISARLLDLPVEHRALSVFRNFDEFARLNPIVKAPTFLTDDGTMLIDSSLILDHLDHLVAPQRRLMPEDPVSRTRSLHLTGLALAAMDKAVQGVYELALRPADKLHTPWLERVLGQLGAAFELLEARAALGSAGGWLLGTRITQADVSVAVAWRFTTFKAGTYPELEVIRAERHPVLAALSARAEALPEFVSAPLPLE